MTNVMKVMAGKPKIGGAAFRAPTGTALPTDEKTTLPAAWLEQGYLSSDGLKQAISKAYTSIKAWGGDEVLNVRNEHGVKFSFTLIEALNANVLTTVFGNDVQITPATVQAGTKIALAYSGEEQDNSVWVFEIAYRKRVKRIVAANAQITTSDVTIEYKDDSIIAYPVELTCYPDANGKYFYEYTDDGVKSV